MRRQNVSPLTHPHPPTALSQPATELSNSQLFQPCSFLACMRVLCAIVNKKGKSENAVVVWSRLVVCFLSENFQSRLSLLSLVSPFIFFDVEAARVQSIDCLSKKKKNAAPDARPAATAGGPRRPGGRVRFGRLPRDGPRVGPLLDDAGRVAGRPWGAGLAGGPRIAVGGDRRRV